MTTIMYYFTDKGFDNVRSKYKYLIGKEYYFSSVNKKEKLLDIQKRPAIENGFHIFFISDTNRECYIYDFMEFNDIDYRFEDYETISTVL